MEVKRAPGFTFQLISEHTVDDPSSDLKRLLRENLSEQRGVLLEEVQTYAQRFEAQHGFALEFDDDAAMALVEESIDLDKTIRALCEQKFRDFHHGLTLISRNTGQTSFPITESVVKNAEKELSRWVVKSYRQGETEA